jgi:hypothetical protein
LAALVLVTLSASAANKPDPAPPAADGLAGIQKQYEEARSAYLKAFESLPDTPAGRKSAGELWKGYDKKQAELFLAAVELARAEPRSDAALRALEWVLTTPRSYYHPAGKSALRLATEYQAANPKVGKIVAVLGVHLPGEQADAAAHRAAMAFIQAVAEKNTDRGTRGQAVLALAGEAKRAFAVAEYRRQPDVDRLANSAEKAFEAVVKDYADCPKPTPGNSSTLGEEAKQELFELRHLRVGMVAPEIEGVDLDGKKFRLSDYHGKVVVFNFWGDW